MGNDFIPEMAISRADFEKNFSEAKMNTQESMCQNKAFYEDWIDNLDCDPKVKQILKDTLRATIKVGKQIYQFGKMILNMVIDLARKFPHMTEGALLGLLLSLIIDYIPFLGPWLNTLLRPLLIIIGATLGLAVDVYVKLKEEAGGFLREMFCRE